MAASQPSWPREWLMTDERFGNQLWQAIEALPAQAGIVFRHYGTPEDERAQIAREVAQICRQKGLTLAIAGNVDLARELCAQLVHNPAADSGGLPFSRSAHSVAEALAAAEAGAALIFVSPVNATRSHPARQPLDDELALRIVRAFPGPAIALGGMDRTKFRRLRKDSFYGWAGIDAWIRT